MTRIFAAIAGSVLLLTSACKQSQYPDVTKSFSDTMDIATAAMQTLYGSINSSDVHIYLQEHLFNPAAPLETRGYCVMRGGRIAVADTLLTRPRFAAKDIQARLDLLSTLKAYGNALAALASSSSPQDFDKSVSDLQVSVAKTGKALPGSNIGNLFTAPMASFAGTVGKIVIQRRNAAELDRLIVEAEPAVDQIIDALQGDTRVLTSIAQTNALEEYKGWIAYYNRVSKASVSKAAPFRAEVRLPDCPGVPAVSMTLPSAVPPSPPPILSYVLLDRYRDVTTFEIRKAILDEVEKSQTNYQALMASDAGGTIASMKTANDALVDYARAPDNQLTFDNLMAAYAEFKDDAQTLFQALHGVSAASPQGGS